MSTNHQLADMRALIAAAVGRGDSPATAADWGSIKGRFVVDGKPPTLPPLVRRQGPVLHRQQADERQGRRRQGQRPGERGRVPVRRARRQESRFIPTMPKPLKKPVVLDNKGCSFRAARRRRSRRPAARRSRTPIPVGHNTNIDQCLFNETIAGRRGADQEVRQSRSRCPMPVELQHPSVHEGLRAGSGSSLHGGVRRGRHVRDQEHPGRQARVPVLAREPGYLKDVKLERRQDRSPGPSQAHDRAAARRSTWATSKSRPVC